MAQIGGIDTHEGCFRRGGVLGVVLFVRGDTLGKERLPGGPGVRENYTDLL